jgi:hypothetical protein
MDQELSWRLLLANPGAVALSIKTSHAAASPTRTSFQFYGEYDHFYFLLYRSQSDSMVTSPFVLLGGKAFLLCLTEDVSKVRILIQEYLRISLAVFYQFFHMTRAECQHRADAYSAGSGG